MIELLESSFDYLILTIIAKSTGKYYKLDNHTVKFVSSKDSTDYLDSGFDI